MDNNNDIINETIINAYASAVQERVQAERYVEDQQRRVAQVEHDLDEAFTRLKSAQEHQAMRELMVDALERRYEGLDASLTVIEPWIGSMASLDVSEALRAVQGGSGE